MCLPQERGDSRRAENHPEVGTAVAATNMELGGHASPGRCHPGGLGVCTRPSGFLPGCDLFQPLLRLLRAVNAIGCGGHTQDLSDDRSFCGSVDGKCVQALSHVG